MPADSGSGSSSGGAGIAQYIPLLTTAASAISKGGPKRQYKWNKKAAQDQNAMNRENAEWLLEQNRQLSMEQREYDSPAAQMQRYKDAGLNPMLIYGQGTSGNMGSPVQVGGLPGVNLQAPEASYPDVAATYLGASQVMAGIGLTQARTTESGLKQQAIAVQNEIAKTNPMLNPAVAKAVSDMMENSARLKSSESWYLRNSWDHRDGSSEKMYVRRIHAEVEAAMQKLGLNTTDLAIKNKILESKEFENVVKELNAKWLKDGDVTPEHIRQGFMLLLQKMVR